MLIVTIRTDKPEAEIGLYDGLTELGYETWQAHHELAHTLHTKIEALLQSNQKSWHDIQGVVAYKGPGSFTGLRIGLTTANTLAYASNLPIVGQTGDKWQKTGIARLMAKEDDRLVMPEYGAPAHITQPKK